MTRDDGELASEDATAGRLVLVGTPIGNRGDLSARATRAIQSADLLLCEDTRSPSRLLGADATLPPRLSCFVGNEHTRVEIWLAELAKGRVVAYISEAGMPVWSDPGATLVAAAADAGYPVEVVPGPTAAATALALSGFDARWSQFGGFLERGGKGRVGELERVVFAVGPTILYEAGNRVGALLRDLHERAPDGDTRRVLVARELTKKHEEVVRGTLASLATSLDSGVRGEVTVVVEAAPLEVLDGQSQPVLALAREVFEVAQSTTMRPKARAKRLAQLLELPSRDIYTRLVSRGAGTDEADKTPGADD